MKCLRRPFLVFAIWLLGAGAAFPVEIVGSVAAVRDAVFVEAGARRQP